MKLNKNKLGGALLCIAAVIVLLVLMDLCVGGASEWLYHRSKYGIFHRQQYVLNESNDDIIILGSSRASHHYVPSILTDSLGMSCYNAGSEGMCIYYHYAILASMIERGHCPKFVVYDVMDLDVMKYPGPTFTLDAALDRLAPHYRDFNSIDSLFLLKGWKEKKKMMSLSYRYNSKLVQSVKCNYFPSKENNGYEAVFGALTDTTRLEIGDFRNVAIDEQKLEYISKIVDLAKKNDIKLVFVLSPKYLHDPSNAYDIIKDIANRRKVPFIDCYNEPSLMNPKLFKDVAHLNDDGAHIWSSLFCKKLKSQNK